jgi:SAM-dependent methyltransferase
LGLSSIRKSLGQARRFLTGSYGEPAFDPSTLKGGLPVTTLASAETTKVDKYWSEHTVNSKPFATAEESERYLKWRFEVYPKFKEFMNLYGKHDDEVILDYGCGPGNDLVGFAIYTEARQVAGIDVSPRALALAGHRLGLHGVNPERVRLLQSSDSFSKVPLEDASVDYVHCAGVLHHTSDPQALLADFHRVMRPGSKACVMVYNGDSVWLHLFTAYERMIIQGMFAGLSLDEAFGRNTDGADCPIARCYRAEEFSAICEAAGFDCEYVGGYLSDTELKCYRKYADKALRDAHLADEHKRFIAALTFDEEELPLFNGKHAGIGGVYNLRRR